MRFRSPKITEAGKQSLSDMLKFLALNHEPTIID